MADKKNTLPTFLTQSKNHKISNAQLSKLLFRIKREERTNESLIIDGVKLSVFLAASLGHETDKNSVKNLVKAAVLRAAGLTGDPQNLPDDTTLADIIINDEQFVLLTTFLNAIARHFNPSATVNLAEVKGCETVNDAVEMVEEKINN